MKRGYSRELAVFAVWGFLLALVLWMASSSGNYGFFAWAQISALAVSNASVLVAAVGMTMVILTRHIDISIGSQLSIAGVFAGLLVKAGLPMAVVVALTITAGFCLGAINGWLVAGLRLPSIVVTLATLVIGREALRWARSGEFVRDLPASFQWFGLGQDLGQAAIIGIALAVFLFFAWALHSLAGARAIFAVGSDAEASRLAGLRPHYVEFATFSIMGGLLGLAALLNAVRFVDIDPNAGNGLELRVIAAVVVGGTAITGGRGRLLGTLAGVLLLGTIGPALVFLRIQPEWEKAIQGIIILFAVALDSQDRRSRIHARSI